MSERVQCPSCGSYCVGTYVKVHREVLAIVEFLERCTAQEVYKHTKDDATLAAVRGRLRILYQQGLLGKIKEGHRVYYYRSINKEIRNNTNHGRPTEI